MHVRTHEYISNYIRCGFICSIIDLTFAQRSLKPSYIIVFFFVFFFPRSRILISRFSNVTHSSNFPFRACYLTRSANSKFITPRINRGPFSPPDMRTPLESAMLSGDVLGSPLRRSRSPGLRKFTRFIKARTLDLRSRPREIDREKAREEKKTYNVRILFGNMAVFSHKFD